MARDPYTIPGYDAWATRSDELYLGEEDQETFDEYQPMRLKPLWRHKLEWRWVLFKSRWRSRLGRMMRPYWPGLAARVDGFDDRVPF